MEGVWKALGVSTAADLDGAGRFSGVVDGFVFDAKPPEGADRPGGLGTAWDYALPWGNRRPASGTPQPPPA